MHEEKVYPSLLNGRIFSIFLTTVKCWKDTNGNSQSFVNFINFEQ